MIWFTKDDGSVATVVAIDDGWYALESYASSEDQRTCRPIRQWRLVGNPNATDIMAALGEGWENDSTDLPEQRSVPKTVTARQLRLWMVRHQLSLAAVDAAIDAIPDQQQRDEVRVEWEYAPYVERSHPMLLPLAAALGLTGEQVDQAFLEAATL